MESIQQIKNCVHCKIPKSLNEFPVNGGTRDKHATICKECGKKYFKRWREKKKLGIPTSWPELSQEEKHRRHKESTKKYRETHREELRASGIRYYAQNREYCIEYSRKARQSKEYKKRHCIEQQKRRARKLGKGGDLTIEEWNIICEKYGNRCLACGRTDIKLTMDHIIPLALGGRHDMENIQPLCYSCNCKKFTKIIDYRERRR